MGLGARDMERTTTKPARAWLLSLAGIRDSENSGSFWLLTRESYFPKKARDIKG